MLQQAFTWQKKPLDLFQVKMEVLVAGSAHTLFFQIYALIFWLEKNWVASFQSWSVCIRFSYNFLGIPRAWRSYSILFNNKTRREANWTEISSIHKESCKKVFINYLRKRKAISWSNFLVQKEAARVPTSQNESTCDC